MEIGDLWRMLLGEGRPIPNFPTECFWWTSLDGSHQPNAPALEEIPAAQFTLSAEVNDWLKVGGVGLALAPLELSKTKTTWKVQVSYPGFYNLFGAIAHRMFLTVAGEENLYVCDACAEVYIRTERAPRSGQENFCSPECRKLSVKRAVQRYRSGQAARKNKKTRPRK